MPDGCAVFIYLNLFVVGQGLFFLLKPALLLRSCLLIAAFLVNTFSFMAAAWYLLRLGRELIGKGKFVSAS